MLDLTPEQLIGIAGNDKKQRKIEHKGPMPGPEFYANLVRQLGLDKEARLEQAKKKMRKRYGLRVG